MSTPRYLSDNFRSINCSTHVQAAVYSDPYVAVSTVAYFLLNESMGITLRRCIMPITDLHVRIQCIRLAST